MVDPFCIQEAPSAPRQPKVISMFAKKKKCPALLILSKNKRVGSPKSMVSNHELWLWSVSINTVYCSMDRDSVLWLCTV